MFVFYIRFAWVTLEILHSWPEQVSSVSLKEKKKAKKPQKPQSLH